MWQSETDFELVDELFDSPFYEAYNELTETGLSNELARKVVTAIIPQYRDGKIEADHLARTALFKAFSSLVKFERNPLLGDEPTTIALIGATGVGKTTTVAKLASRVALQERRRVELVTLDTYRIAAVEQLKTYAEIIGAGCHVVRSVFELDAVLRRLPPDASVLIDTTGKSPHDLADQHEVADYLRKRREIRKCLVTQATAHPIDSFAAVRKFEMYGADCLALTKMDETMRPGAMVELAAQSALPLIYMCMGQRVPEDLQEATPQNFIAHVFRTGEAARF
jgi:flagellar biosynthesis protein FlhF